MSNAIEKLKKQVMQLDVNDRLELLRAIAESLQIPPSAANWQFLVSRAHPWRKQLYVKGRKLLAFTVWQDMLSNQLSPEQAADNWELPLAAIHEVIRYCETHQDLLRLEAEEERDRLQEKGVSPILPLRQTL